MTRWYADSTACIYLHALLSSFHSLVTDEWRQHQGDQWNSEPGAVQGAVRDSLMKRLGCKVRLQAIHAPLILTVQRPNTVHIFLAACKQCSFVMAQEGTSFYTNPLLDTGFSALSRIVIFLRHASNVQANDAVIKETQASPGRYGFVSVQVYQLNKKEDR
ncbi:hypothetical protein KSF_108150 [Reticulibacter mediterranei]|uniref:Uncharacterized protein n=2 Tax=Reticulibacter mediterranei TaxID=2778369 RepID=A0A8J3J1S0_9CHLR|nr:hypothetical protein KSF_108150 [Reticulibacter mediterranei]